MRITLKELEMKVNTLNEFTNNKFDFQLEQANGGIRLTRRAHSVDVTPRTTKSEQWRLVQCLIQGVGIGRRLQKSLDSK